MTDIVAAAEGATGLRFPTVRPLAGGAMCATYELRTEQGERVFAKTMADAPPELFSSEAASLRLLADSASVEVPEVVGYGAEVLVLSWVDAGQPSRTAAARFGTELSAMHDAGMESFGAPWSGFAGMLPLPNEPAPTWADFFGERRLQPLIALAHDRNAVPSVQPFEQVRAKLPDLAGPDEPPARLHGDLWSGNVLFTAASAVLVDPATYGGHREFDLAMLTLFGAPHLDAILAAYQERHALADGWEERLLLWQLAPLLVHSIIFGGGYAEQATAAARRFC
jgi:fructosamine-3-kinase